MIRWKVRKVNEVESDHIVWGKRASWQTRVSRRLDILNAIDYLSGKDLEGDFNKMYVHNELIGFCNLKKYLWVLEYGSLDGYSGGGEEDD